MHAVVDRAEEEILLALRHGHKVDRNNDRPFETLRLVNRNDVDAVATMIGWRFVGGEFDFPFGAKINGKLFEPAYVIAACALEKDVNIGKRTEPADLNSDRRCWG